MKPRKCCHISVVILCGDHRSQVTKYFVSPCSQNTKCSRPRLRDRASLEDSPTTVPASGFRFPLPVQNETTEMLSHFRGHFVRAGGIEPPTPAWKAGVLPLNYTRIFLFTYTNKDTQFCKLQLTPSFHLIYSRQAFGVNMVEHVLSLLHEKRQREERHHARMQMLHKRLVRNARAMLCTCSECNTTSRISEWSFVQQYTFDRAGWFPDDSEKCPIQCPACMSLNRFSRHKDIAETLLRLFQEHVSLHTIFKEVLHRDGSRGKIFHERMTS